MGSRLEKNSAAVRKRIEEHTFTDEDGDEYEGSAFNGFGDYFRRKKIKLQNRDTELRSQFSASNTPQIFKGVVAHVSGYTQPSLDWLHRELVRHGAGFLQYLDGKTVATHIIASSFPPKKTVDFSRYRIVKPAWVVESINAGKLLPWTDYRVFEEGGPRQRTLRFDGDGRMVSQASQVVRIGYKEQTENSFYTAHFKASDTAGQTQNSSVAEGSPSSSQFKSKQSSTPVEGIEDENEDEEEDSMVKPSPITSIDEQDNRQHEAAEVATEPPVAAPRIPSPALSDMQEVPSAASPVLKPQEGAEAASEDTEPSPAKKPMTSEEHNALLLSDPRLRKSSTANPDFIQQYYSESRLHHLSTWKAELKSKMQRLAAEKGPTTKPVKRKPGARRYVLHVDFDSFFCAVSLKKAPEYVDKPAVVAHSTGTGSEIASCNYPARAFGVKNGMWMKRALELCPDLKTLPYDFPAYEEASALFYGAILEVGGVVQSVSIDEALVDVTSIVLEAAASQGVGVDEGSIWREQEKAAQVALELRKRIKEKTGCNVSVGIGGNILLAKVALRKAKPAGQHQIKPEEVLEFLGELQVGDLPGVAYSISGKLEEMGIKLVKDIRQTSKERLVSVLGPKTGEKLWEYSRGIDRAEVGEQSLRKSVSAEVNWGIRFINQQEAEEFVMNLAKELERRLLNEVVKGKQLTMKIMRRALDAPLDPPKHLGHGKCDTFNKSVLFGIATNAAEFIGKEAVSILRSYKFSPGDLRGLGLQLTKLEPIKATAAPDGSQKRLTFGNAPPPLKRSRLDQEEDQSTSQKPTFEIEQDPIADDVQPPPKHKVHPALALARAGEADEKAKTPLNISGTQFILPPNPDPAVLAELPPDIRSKLMAQGKPKLKAPVSSPLAKPGSPSVRSRVQSPSIDDEIPPDFDREVFEALPADIKADLLAEYRRSRSNRPPPVTPRKDKSANLPPPPPAGKATPTKPTGGRGGARGGAAGRGRGRGRGGKKSASGGTQYFQTNFLLPSKPSRAAEAADAETAFAAAVQAIPDLDPGFLAALPEEIRAEVVAGRHHQPNPTTGGGPAPAALALELKAPPGLVAAQRTAAAHARAAAPRAERKVRFPPRPPRARFTTSDLTQADEVRDMLAAWHRETRDEGPHRDDVAVFEAYLARVVGTERDMDKARGLVKWADWLVEAVDDDPSVPEGGRGKACWREAVVSAKQAVNEAMRNRGLGEMRFD